MNGRDREESSIPLIILPDEDTGDKYARAVAGKGVGEHGVVDWLILDISREPKSLGQGGGGNRITLKADGERPVKSPRDAVAHHHGGLIVSEVSAPEER